MNKNQKITGNVGFCFLGQNILVLLKLSEFNSDIGVELRKDRKIHLKNKTMIQGVVIKKLLKNEDSRGWLTEIWRNDESGFSPTMSYVSVTKPAVVRGPHEHNFQSDGFVFLGPGNFRLYLWDNRENSLTFKEEMQIEVGENNPVFAIVPPGVVHGYKCISDVDAYCINLPDKLYAGVGKKEDVDEVRHEKDPNSPFKII